MVHTPAYLPVGPYPRDGTFYHRILPTLLDPYHGAGAGWVTVEFPTGPFPTGGPPVTNAQLPPPPPMVERMLCSALDFTHTPHRGCLSGVRAFVLVQFRLDIPHRFVLYTLLFRLRVN